MAVSKFRKRIRKLLSCLPVLEKREIRHFHVLVVVQRQLRNVEINHVQRYCFANPNLIAFLPFSLPSLSSLLKLPNIKVSTLLTCTVGVMDRCNHQNFNDVIQQTLKQYPHHNTKANQQWFPQHQDATGQS